MGETILLAVDGSDQSKRAFEYAADHFSEESLVALTVVDLGDMNYEYDVDQGEYPVQWLEDAEANAESLLTTFTERAVARDVSLETAIRFGQPSREIVAYADERDADTIVIGSHGRDDVSWTHFGSVAGNVVKRAPTTVVVVR